MTHLDQLIKDFEDGKVLPILGPGIFDSTAWATKALVASLARFSDYPSDEPMILDQVALHFAKKYTPSELVQHVRGFYQQSEPIRLHYLLSEIFGIMTGLQTEPVVITLCYDDHLESAAKARHQPATSVVLPWETTYSTSQTPSIIHLLGCFPVSESLRITSEEKEDVFRLETSLYPVCWGYLASRSWLCIGTDLNDRWLQNLHRRVSESSKGKHVRLVYTCGSSLTGTSTTWWKPYWKSLVESPETLLEELNNRLRWRAHKRVAVSGQDSDAAESSPERPLFKQLLPYQPEDKDLFFGRDHEARLIFQQVLANPLTVLSGPSGSGKSSLLNAGVVPLLLREGLTVVRTRILGNADRLLVEDDIRPAWTDDLAPIPPQTPLKPHLAHIARGVGPLCRSYRRPT